MYENRTKSRTLIHFAFEQSSFLVQYAIVHFAIRMMNFEHDPISSFFLLYIFCVFFFSSSSMGENTDGLNLKHRTIAAHENSFFFRIKKPQQQQCQPKRYLSFPERFAYASERWFRIAYKFPTYRFTATRHFLFYNKFYIATCVCVLVINYNKCYYKLITNFY